MKIEVANSIPLRKILYKAGFNPQSETPTILTYVSPFRRDGTYQLIVDVPSNTWLDNGILLGGGVVAFVCAYLKSRGEEHTETDALRWIRNMMSSPPKLTTKYYPDYSEADAKFRIRGILPLNNHLLFEYLDSRRIPRNLAARHLKEVIVVNKQTKKRFRALGFANLDGGFAIRNRGQKANVGVSTVGLIRGTAPKSSNINLFKDIFDFLSVLTLNKGKHFSDDCIILNGYVHINDAIPYIRNYGYENAYTWFENTAEGIHLTRAISPLLKSGCEIKHVPMNKFYRSYRDTNAWLIKSR